jgi:hypothetical protein
VTWYQRLNRLSGFREILKKKMPSKRNFHENRLVPLTELGGVNEFQPVLSMFVDGYGWNLI